MDKPDLQARLRFLQSSQAYGASAQRPQCIETHMSWVFLTDELVFKLKKAVRFPFLDFTTLEARAFYCREELRLNQRLAPGVYLGVLALQWNENGLALVPERELPAPGETLDWLVQMRRLPAHRMMHELISSNTLLPADVDALAAVLGRFFQSAPAFPMQTGDYLARFTQEQAANAAVLLQPRFGLRDAMQAVAQLAAATSAAAGLLRARERALQVRDGHGDLRPEHVCLLPPPLVIDCLEFNQQLRQLDPFDELAYLGLECAMQGAAWVGARLVAGVGDVLGQRPHPALVHFYAAHRGLLRARLAVAHLLDAQPRTPERWLPLGERYISQGLQATQAFNAAMRHAAP
jgi:uncharacterized protein